MGIVISVSVFLAMVIVLFVLAVGTPSGPIARRRKGQ